MATTQKTAPVSSRGAERTRRRAKQAVNAEQAKQDALLVPPKGAAKAAAQEAAKQTKLARFGASGTAASTRKTAQRQNARKADEEAVTLAAPVEPDLGAVEPGTQPTARQLRILAKQVQKDVNAEATEIGRAAGRMVRDAVLGRKVRQTPHTRARHVAEAQDALQRAAANAAR